MANDDVKQRIQGWCTSDDSLRLVDDVAAPGADFTIALRAGGADLRVNLPSGSDRVAVRSVADFPADVLDWQGSAAISGSSRTFNDALSQLSDSRPSPVSAVISDEAGKRAGVVTSWIYLDGLTKQSFMAAVDEVARTRRLLDRLAEDLTGHRAETKTAEPAAKPTAAGAGAEPAMAGTAEQLAAVEAITQPTEEGAGAEPATAGAAAPVAGAEASARPAAVEANQQPAAAPTPVAQPASIPTPVPGPTFTSSQPTPVSSFTPEPQRPQPQLYTPQPQPQQQQPQPQQQQPQPQPQPGPGGQWAPTHRVPGQGMQAWAAPDPNGAVVATLGGNLPVQVSEMRGAWAHVVCSNGWQGWVDGRLLAAGA